MGFDLTQAKKIQLSQHWRMLGAGAKQFRIYNKKINKMSKKYFFVLEKKFISKKKNSENFTLFYRKDKFMFTFDHSHWL